MERVELNPVVVICFVEHGTIDADTTLFSSAGARSEKHIVRSLRGRSVGDRAWVSRNDAGRA
jgi:hypothetical protein